MGDERCVARYVGSSNLQEDETKPLVGDRVQLARYSIGGWRALQIRCGSVACGGCGSNE